MNIFIQIINIFIHDDQPPDRFQVDSHGQRYLSEPDYGDQPFYDALGRYTAEQLQNQQQNDAKTK